MLVVTMNQFMNKFIGWGNNRSLLTTSVMRVNLLDLINTLPTTRFREHSYRYDSFDAKYETLKYTRPKECSVCPLANEVICQKVYKVKITTDLRKYTAPDRGSKVLKTIYSRRIAIERVNAYPIS